MSKTLDQTHGPDGIAKAAELIEVRGTADLTLHDRRVFNLLYENAGQQICEDKEHVLAISALRGNHKGGERVKDSIIRLMKTLVQVTAKDKNGKAATKLVQILSDITISDDDNDAFGQVIYSLSKGMREIISNSTSWGRIRANVMFHFTSKYSLTLYELICLRVHLKYRSSEDFELEDFRSLLGVPIDKLKRSPDLIRYCIQPATLEINKLSDMGVQVEPIRRGGQQRGAVKGFKVTWWPKNGQELKEAWSELRQSRVGRKARMTGTVEEVDLEPPPRPLPPVIETPAFPSGKQATNRIEFRQPINAEDQRRILLPAGWQIDGNPERWKGGTFTAEVMELYSRWGRRLQGG